MQFGFMVTEGGKHSDEKMAVATAARIIEIGDTATGTRGGELRKLELKIIDILEEHHKKVSTNEVSKLTADPQHIATVVDPMPKIDDTFKQIMDAARATPAAKAAFETPEAQRGIKEILASFTATNMVMHRDWHAAGKTGHGADLKDIPGHNPDQDHVKAWNYKRLSGGLGSGLPLALPKELIKQ